MSLALCLFASLLIPTRGSRQVCLTSPTTKRLSDCKRMQASAKRTVATHGGRHDKEKKISFRRKMTRVERRVQGRTTWLLGEERGRASKRNGHVEYLSSLPSYSLRILLPYMFGDYDLAVAKQLHMCPVSVLHSSLSIALVASFSGHVRTKTSHQSHLY